MKKSVFITGSSGFIGRILLKKMDWSSFKRVYCLCRDPRKIDFLEKKPVNLKIIRGDLLDRDSYFSILRQVDTVVHLAALTGKASRKEYYRVNTQGTRYLVQGCQKSGVKHFLYVSTIAVKFINKKRYFYADSKLQAEEIIKASGIGFTLVRPAMVLGKDSPLFAGFSRFAFLPLIPVFGRGEVKIQPVFVDDLTAVIRHILKHSVFNNQTLEIGGPQQLTIQDLLGLIHQGKKPGKVRFVHIPLGLTVLLLTLTEPLFYPLLPFTLGQLATFRNDGTAEENEVFLKLSPGFKNIDGMVHESLETRKEAIIPAILEKECRVFCQYLVQQKANQSVVDKYRECHGKVEFIARNRFDSFLMGFSSRNTFSTRLVDSFSCFFFPASLLRKKLVFMLAILETSPPYFLFFDRISGQGKLRLFLKLVTKGMGFGIALFLSFILFLPFKIIWGGKGKPVAGGN